MSGTEMTNKAGRPVVVRQWVMWMDACRRRCARVREDGGGCALEMEGEEVEGRRWMRSPGHTLSAARAEEGEGSVHGRVCWWCRERGRRGGGMGVRLSD